jgi:hypothetical protein
MNLKTRIARLERMKPRDDAAYRAMLVALSDVTAEGQPKRPQPTTPAPEPTAEEAEESRKRRMRRFPARRSWLQDGLDDRELILFLAQEQGPVPATVIEQQPSAEPVAEPHYVLPLTPQLTGPLPNGLCELRPDTEELFDD